MTDQELNEIAARAKAEAIAEERKRIVSILLGIAARESGSDHPQSEYDQANLARNLRMVVEQLSDLPWDGEFWLQSVCGMAFDHGAALGRIKALEGIYMSVDAVLGSAENKGYLRDIWARLEIPGRCTHARQPHPFKQLERIECPYPDCPDGTTNETILVFDNEGNEYELTRFIVRHGEALVVEWQQPEAQIDHEVEGRTDLARLRELRRGPIFAQMIDGQVASFVGLQRHMESAFDSVTNELGLHWRGPIPPRPPLRENLQLTPMPASEEFTIFQIPDQHPPPRGTVMLRCPRCDAGAFYVMPENARPNVPIWASCNCGHRFDARAAIRRGLEPRLIERSVFGDAIRARSERARLVAEAIALDPPPAGIEPDDDDDDVGDDDD